MIIYLDASPCGFIFTHTISLTALRSGNNRSAMRHLATVLNLRVLPLSKNFFMVFGENDFIILYLIDPAEGNKVVLAA